jgi:hypothetical protein
LVSMFVANGTVVVGDGKKQKFARSHQLDVEAED